MNPARWATVMLAVCLGLCACNVGKGVGAAKGTLYEYGCSSKSGDYRAAGETEAAKPESPQPFDLKPSFFAGELIDDLREHSTGGSEVMSNRVIIRLQRSGKEIEQNDVLTFDVSSSYEVARCVRGRVDSAGKNDWDESNCYRASDNGPGRMRVQWDGFVHGALALKSTCNANLIGAAISAPITTDNTPPPPVLDGSWSSWVEFQEFGGASDWNNVPTERKEVDPKFHVKFGERVYASTFFLTLTDNKVVDASIHDLPLPRPQIGATLGGDPTTGMFDFDLERGQGAQFFP
jgi:hypothetical protein